MRALCVPGPRSLPSRTTVAPIDWLLLVVDGCAPFNRSAYCRAVSSPDRGSMGHPLVGSEPTSGCFPSIRTSHRTVTCEGVMHAAFGLREHRVGGVHRQRVLNG